MFDVYLGECIAPFVALDPLRAALPVHRPTMTMPVDHSECDGEKHNACRLEAEALHQSMRRRWNTSDGMFRDAHKTQTIKDLYNNLNYRNKLTDQLEYLQGATKGGDAVRVSYTSSGRPTAAIIRDNHAIVDYVLFQIICRSEDEAYYLITIINSNALASAAEKFMARGLFGARHFQRQGWKLPIPRYDSHNPLHRRLSKLGKTAEQECQALIDQSDIKPKPAGKAQSSVARSLLRHEWQPTSKTAQAIEAAVAELLSDPAQAKLAEEQMAAS